MSSNSAVGFFGGGGGNKNVSNSNNIFASVNESRLRPEERLYHTILVKNISNINNSTITTTPSTSLAYEYAEASESRRQELLTEALSSEVENAMDRSKGGRSDNLHRESLESRAERDLWDLLDRLSKYKLLDDINDIECERCLQNKLKEFDITPIYSNEDVIKQAEECDDRLKKGKILKAWLESAASDKVVYAPPPSDAPWLETYKNILNMQDDPENKRDNYLKSSEPDAQLTKSGKMLRLDGTDMGDQELLLKSIWQMIRSGKLLEAQRLAYKHGMFWLASSLIGESEQYYKSISFFLNEDMNSTEENTVRLGNSKKPIWLRTCWKYAEKLGNDDTNLSLERTEVSSNSRNKQMSTIIGVYEMTSYAALSNNVNVILKSPLITSWEDKIWVYVKALHDNNVAEVIHRNRNSKKRHSHYYPGCDNEVLKAEEDLIRKVKEQTFGISISSLDQLFEKNETNIRYDEVPNAQNLLYLLQASVMKGSSRIKQCLEREVMDFLINFDDKKARFPGSSRILRVLCHFILWLKHTAPNFSNSPEINDLVENQLLDISVATYIDHLIANKQRSLVAAYAKHLCRPRRIEKYVKLLQSIRSSSHDVSAEEKEMIKLAKLYFPDDVVDITKAVVEAARDGNVNSMILENDDQSNITKSIVAFTPSRRSRREMSMFSPSNTEINSTSKKPSTVSTYRRSVFSRVQEDHDIAFITKRHPISDEDIQRMESLKWLFIEENHRIESLKQSNSIITSMLLESKMKKLDSVRLLLDTYLPPDSIKVAKDVLELLYSSSQSTQGDSIVQVVSPPTREQRHISLIEQSFTPTVSKIRFWCSLVDSMNDYDTWRTEYDNFNLERDRLLGSVDIVNTSLRRSVPRLMTIAEKVTKSLLRTMQCDAHRDYSKYGIGMSKIFKDAQKSAIDLFVYAVEDCQLIDKLNVPCQEYDDSINEIRLLLQELKDRKIVDDKLLKSTDELRQIVSFKERNKDDQAITRSTLAICRQQLIDIRDGSDMLKLLIEFLFFKYLEVCSCTASSFMIFKDHQSNAHYWCSKGIKIAEILALEDEGTKYYDEIDSTTLEQMLNKINNLTLKMLDIVPSFQLLNELK